MIRVIDGGDTIKLAGHHIDFRFASIDAPEKKQPFGLEATESLQYLVGQSVTIYQVDTDRYKRPVAFFVLDDGSWVTQILHTPGTHTQARLILHEIGRLLLSGLS